MQGAQRAGMKGYPKRASSVLFLRERRLTRTTIIVAAYLVADDKGVGCRFSFPEFALGVGFSACDKGIFWVCWDDRLIWA